MGLSLSAFDGIAVAVIGPGGFIRARAIEFAMTTDRINNTNSVLMLMAAGAAFVAPFEIFLLSYAILGPLHYLTELSWLYDRDCFLAGRGDYFPLIVLCFAVIVIPVTHWPSARTSEFAAMMNYAAFAFAAVLLWARTAKRRVVGCGVMALLLPVVANSELCRVFFWPLLPTIIHVFIFTGAFILLGALRGRSKSALASLVVLGLCTLVFFCVPMMPIHAVSSYARAAYAPFEHINWIVMNALRLTPAGSADPLYESPQGLAVMRFIAFAYLHHYLNWFSKTSIIKWNRISRARGATIVSLWFASLWIIAHHGAAGSMLLASLSYAHGFLELPLDHKTFVYIARELRASKGARFSPGLLYQRTEL